MKAAERMKRPATVTRTVTPTVRTATKFPRTVGSAMDAARHACRIVWDGPDRLHATRERAGACPAALGTMGDGRPRCSAPAGTVEVGRLTAGGIGGSAEEAQAESAKLVKAISMAQMLAHDYGDGRRDRQDGHGDPVMIVGSVMEREPWRAAYGGGGPDRLATKTGWRQPIGATVTTVTKQEKW